MQDVIWNPTSPHCCARLCRASPNQQPCTFSQAVFRRESHRQFLPPTWQPLPLFPLPRNRLPVSYHLFLCVNSNRQQHNCHHKQYQSFHTIYYLVETYKSNCYSDTKVAGIIYYIGIQITDYITRITDRCPRREIKIP